MNPLHPLFAQLTQHLNDQDIKAELRCDDYVHFTYKSHGGVITEQRSDMVISYLGVYVRYPLDYPPCGIVKAIKSICDNYVRGDLCILYESFCDYFTKNGIESYIAQAAIDPYIYICHARYHESGLLFIEDSKIELTFLGQRIIFQTNEVHPRSIVEWISQASHDYDGRNRKERM